VKADYWNNYDFSQGSFEIERFHPFDKGVTNLARYKVNANFQKYDFIMEDEYPLRYLLDTILQD